MSKLRGQWSDLIFMIGVVIWLVFTVIGSIIAWLGIGPIVGVVVVAAFLYFAIPLWIWCIKHVTSGQFKADREAAALKREREEECKRAYDAAYADEWHKVKKWNWGDPPWGFTAYEVWKKEYYEERGWDL